MKKFGIIIYPLITICLLYLIFSIGNGSFNFYSWKETEQSFCGWVMLICTALIFGTEYQKIQDNY